MTKTVNPAELEIIREFEGYTLARYQGNLGIWSILPGVDWNATFELPQGSDLVYTGEMEAELMEEDCGLFADPFHFEDHVSKLKSEAAYLAKLEG